MTTIGDQLKAIGDIIDNELGIHDRRGTQLVRDLVNLDGKMVELRDRLDIHAGQISGLMDAKPDWSEKARLDWVEDQRQKAAPWPEQPPEPPMGVQEAERITARVREGLILPDPARDAANLAALANWTNASAWGRVSDDATANARVAAMLDHLHGLVAIAITGGEVPQPDGAES